MQKCDRTKHAAKVRELRAKLLQVDPEMRPLYKHLLRLSINSINHGSCQQGGRYLRSAKKWLRPGRLNGR